MISIVRYGPEFKGEQFQDLNPNKETATEYVARGGVTHFRGANFGMTICGSSIGASVRKWRHTTCIACFRARAGIRNVIGK